MDIFTVITAALIVAIVIGAWAGWLQADGGSDRPRF